MAVSRLLWQIPFCLHARYLQTELGLAYDQRAKRACLQDLCWLATLTSTLLAHSHKSKARLVPFFLQGTEIATDIDSAAIAGTVLSSQVVAV